MGELILATQATPSSPSAGTVGIFVDSADGVTKQISSAGVVTSLVGATSVFGRTGAVVAVTGDYYGVVSAALTGATAASRYVGATASGAPVAGTFAVGDVVVDQTGKLWVCTAAGSPGTWAQVGGGSGNLAKLFDSTLGADAASIDTGSGGFSTSYAQLRFHISGRTDRAGAPLDGVKVQFNNDTGSNYFVNGDAALRTSFNTGLLSCATAINAAARGSLVVDVPNYADTTYWKTFHGVNTYFSDTIGNSNVAIVGGGWENTAAINRIKISPNLGTNLKAGTRLTVYGMDVV